VATKKVDLIIAARDQTKQAFGSVDRGLTDIIGKQKLMAVGAAAAATAFTVAFNKMVQATYDLLDGMSRVGDRMDKMSQRTGVAADELQRWDYVVQLGGATGEQFEAALKRLARAIYDADRGVKESRDAFEKLGVNIYGADGRLRDVNDIMYDVADGMKRAKSETERMGLALVVLGRGGTQILPTLKQGSAAIREQMSDLDKLGGVLSEDFVRNSAAFVDAQLRMRTAWTNFKGTLSAEALEGAAEALNTLAETIGNLAKDDDLKIISEWIANEIVGFAILAKKAKKAADELERLRDIKPAPLNLGFGLGKKLRGGDEGYGEVPPFMPDVPHIPGALRPPKVAGGGGAETLADDTAKWIENRKAAIEALRTLAQIDRELAEKRRMEPERTLAAQDTGEYGEFGNLESDAWFQEQLAGMDEMFGAFDEQNLAELDDAIKKFHEMNDGVEELGRTFEDEFIGAFSTAMTTMILQSENAADAFVNTFKAAFAAVASAAITFGLKKLIGLPFSEGGTVPAMALGGSIPRAYAGYAVPDGPRGMDSRLILGMPGEEVISRSLSQRLDRFLAAAEVAQTYAPASLSGGGTGSKIEVHYHGGMPVKRSDFVKMGDELARAVAEARRRIL